MGYLTDDLSAGKRLKVGMVGGGRGAFFAAYHRAAMRLTNRFEVAAGTFSSDPAVSREAGGALGVAGDRIYPDASAMAEAEAARGDGIDVAVIVTPNHLHFEACKAFVANGIPVICDKPLVNALSEADALAEMLSGTDAFFAVTYTYRGYPMVRDARERVAAGEIGELRFVYVEYLLEWGAAEVSKLGARGGQWRDDPAKAGPTGLDRRRRDPCLRHDGIRVRPPLRRALGAPVEAAAQQGP